MKKISMIMFLCCFLTASLYSQVESITIRWTTMLCQNNCLEQLLREFQKIRGIDQILINPGQADLTWKPNETFQYNYINLAMRMVGLSIRDIRIKITGTITHIGDRFYITTAGGAYTRFELLNPVIPIPGGVTAEFNEAARKISPTLRLKLLEAERLRQIATIEGPIFMPHRHANPTQIVVDHLSFRAPQP